MGKAEEKSVLSFFMTIGFFGGILYANLFAKEYILSNGMISSLFLNRYIDFNFYKNEYLWYVLQKRSIPVITLGIISCTRYKKVCASFFVLWTGFLAGILMTSSVIKQGIKGIVICIIAMTPHIICYVVFYVILLWYLFQYPRGNWNIQKTICCIFMFFMGVVLESYVNPIMMKWFISIL